MIIVKVVNGVKTRKVISNRAKHNYNTNTKTKPENPQNTPRPFKTHVD